MRRVLALLFIALIAVALFYISRFWGFNLWSRDGLFGVAELRPQGGLLATWLRGTQLAPFELVIWGVIVFISLTWLQKLFDHFKSD